MHPDTVNYISLLDWPENVRQLENTCRWLTAMASGREVLVSDLPPKLVDQPEILVGATAMGNWE